MSPEENKQLEEIARELRMLRTPLPSRCLTTKEAAEVLGISQAKVRQLIQAEELVAVTFSLGGRKIYRVQLKDLEEFLERLKKKTDWNDDGDIIEIPNFDD